MCNIEQTLTVAACIGTFNQAMYLDGAITSALNQTRPFSEIWIADDCSTDHTMEVATSFAAKDKRIFYHRNLRNVGPARNLSWALSQPVADLIVRLDSDDRLEDRYVEVLASLLEKYPQAGYAHCNVWEIDFYGSRSRPRILSRVIEYENCEAAIRSNSYGLKTAANCLMFRATALKQAQYYLLHPDWTASEDWDLALRMALNGWGNVFSSEFLSNYRQWIDPQGARALRKIQEVSTNNFIFRNVLIPEYQRRGWITTSLVKAMRSKAVEYADALDSPHFSDSDRREYERLLRDMGDSYSLDLSFLLAKAGLNPMRRQIKRLRLKIKDILKITLRNLGLLP